MNNFKHIKIALFIVFLSLSIFGYNPVSAEGAKNYYRLPQKALIKNASFKLILYEGGQNIILDALVDPGGTPINSVGLNLEYQKEFLKLTDIKTESSFCSLFVGRVIDNENGLSTIACGTPNPGINTEKLVARFIFEKQGPGQAEIAINKESMILANDGYGTNVINSFATLNITLD